MVFPFILRTGHCTDLAWLAQLYQNALIVYYLGIIPIQELWHNQIALDKILRKDENFDNFVW